MIRCGAIVRKSESSSPLFRNFQAASNLLGEWPTRFRNRLPRGPHPIGQHAETAPKVREKLRQMAALAAHLLHKSHILITNFDAQNSPHTAMSNVLNEFRRNNVRYVRVTWVDLANVVRYKILSIAHFRNLMESANSNECVVAGSIKVNTKRGVTLPAPALGLVNLSLCEGVTGVGEFVYVFDPDSARILNFAPGHAIIFGWFESKEVPLNATSFSYPACPRNRLNTIMQDAKKTDDVDFLVGFETEVIFLSSTDPITAVSEHGWSDSKGILAGTPTEKALGEIADALEVAGIELQMYHPEAAPGQYEIVTGPLPPLQACDALVTTREIIMNIAAKYGMRATLAPRVYTTSCGSAAHTHISLRSGSWPSRRTAAPVAVGPDVYLNDLEAAFLSGLLEHLPAAIVFTMLTRASYGRMVDGIWSGGTYVVWGRDNKEVPVRVTGRVDSAVESPLSGPRFEIKSLDGTACPYAAISALLAAGMLGVREKAKLRSHGLHVMASELTPSQREKYGSNRRMPLNLDEAREALAKDEKMRQALDPAFIERFLAVNKVLDKELSAEDEKKAMVKLVRAY